MATWGGRVCIPLSSLSSFCGGPQNPTSAYHREWPPGPWPGWRQITGGHLREAESTGTGGRTAGLCLDGALLILSYFTVLSIPQNACQILMKRLEPIISQNPNGTWEEWVSTWCD